MKSPKVTCTLLLGLALVIFAGTLWLHWPSVAGGFLTRMDDDEYLRQSERWQGLGWGAVRWAFTSAEPYYQPLPRLSHVLDYQLWGTNARGHHAVPPYVLRAVPGATISTPLDWKEVTNKLDPGSFTAKKVLAMKADPFAEFIESFGKKKAKR